MRYWIRAYQANLKTQIAAMLQYRMAILIWAVWGFVGPLIMLALWSATASSTGGAIQKGTEKFTHADFATYYVAFLIVGHLVMSWDAFEFAWRIRDGGLSARLLKPIHPIHQDIATNIAFKLVTSAMLLPVWIILILLLKPSPISNWGQAALAIPAIGLAALVRYLTNYALACLAFWTTRVEALNQLYFAVDQFLSGSVVPLILMPTALAAVAYYSPFRSMVGFPVELILGRVPSEKILEGFVLQLFWLVIGLAVFRAVWRGGIRQYSAVGA